MNNWRTRLSILILTGIGFTGGLACLAADNAAPQPGEISVRNFDRPARGKAENGKQNDPMHGISVQSINVDAEIQGLTARTTTTYVFKNDSDKPAECTFTFPLPEQAAVDRFAMTVNDKDMLEGTAVYSGDAEAIYKDLLAGNDGTCTAEDKVGKISMLANVGYGGSVPHASAGGRMAPAAVAHTVHSNNGPLGPTVMATHGTGQVQYYVNRTGSQSSGSPAWTLSGSNGYEFKGLTYQIGFGAQHAVFSSGMDVFGLNVQPRVVPFNPAQDPNRQKDPGVLERIGADVYRATIFAVEPHKEKTVVISCVHPLAVQRRAGRLSEAVYRLPFMGLGTLVPAPRLMLQSVVHKPTDGASITASPRSGITRQGDDFLLLAQIAKPAGTTAWTIAVSSPAAEVVSENGCGIQVHRPSPSAPGCFALTALPDGDSGQIRRPMDVLFAVEATAGLSDADRKLRRDFLASVLGALNRDDRVALLALGEQPVALASDLQPVDGATLERAECLIDGLEAGAAADIRPGIAQLAAFCRPQLDRRVKIVYVGSGQRTDASTIRAEVRELLSECDAELFAVHFSSESTRDPILNGAREVDALAALSGAPVTNLAPGVNGTEAGKIFAAELRKPVLRDAQLTLTTADGQSAALANPVQGGLFLNEAHTFYGTYAKAGGARVTLTGTLNGILYRRIWNVSLPVEEKGNASLEKLWARMLSPVGAEDGHSANIDLYLNAIKHQVANRNVAFLVLDSEERYKKLSIARPAGGFHTAKLSPDVAAGVPDGTNDEIIGLRK